MSARLPQRSLATYLVEVYLPKLGGDELPKAAARARSAASEMAREGTPVRFLRSIFIPEDETCFSLYEGPSAEAVREASERAGISFERVAEATDIAAAEIENLEREREDEDSRV